MPHRTSNVRARLLGSYSGRRRKSAAFVAGPEVGPEGRIAKYIRKPISQRPRPISARNPASRGSHKHTYLTNELYKHYGDCSRYIFLVVYIT